AGGMISFVIQHHPHGTLAHLRGKLVRRFARHGSILFGSWSLRQTRGGSIAPRTAGSSSVADTELSFFWIVHFGAHPPCSILATDVFLARPGLRSEPSQLSRPRGGMRTHAERRGFPKPPSLVAVFLL